MGDQFDQDVLRANVALMMDTYNAQALNGSSKRRGMLMILWRMTMKKLTGVRV